jgi:hypothetical protein
MPEAKAENQAKLRIILESPFPGVAYALQSGTGSAYGCVQGQTSSGGNLVFEFPVAVKMRNGAHAPSGPFVQGPKGGRFVYICVGTYAGDAGSCWTRRMKVPLEGIDWASACGAVLETRVPGTGRDGTPACATVKPFAGWTVNRKTR